MLHQSLPLYEGNQPFIYAFYCAEDDDIAFPVLARMYNEGFRIWCASAGGVANDFRTIQRMNSSASIMLFLSKNMLELLRMSDPEAVAAAKNPRLHMTVSVDGTKADRSMWALAVPDELEYTPGNDAAFWLYMYTSDKLEKCRGPWPEKKITCRASGFDAFPERALQEEYRQLENIIMSDASGDGNDGGTESRTETDSPQSRAAYEADDPLHTRKYKNNAGYIEPEPDNYVYAPLDRIEVTKSEEEKEFDAFIGYLDRCVEAEERSVAEQEADRKYIAQPGKNETSGDAGDTVVNISVSDRQTGAYSMPLSPALTLAEDSAPDSVPPAVSPAPELTPRSAEKKETPEAKADLVISMGDPLSPENLNPEARRRRMYENGLLDKVLDPNDIDAVIQRRKKEERLKAEEKEREENERAAKEAEKLLESIEPEDKEDGGKAAEASVPDAAEASGTDKDTGKEDKTDQDKNKEKKSFSGPSEESLESIIDRSDIPGLDGDMPSPEQLAAAPTYVMVQPSGGAPVDAPACLKLIEAGGGMIAVPVPEEMTDLSAGADSGSDEIPDGDDTVRTGVISDNMISGAGFSSAGTLAGFEEIPEKTDKKRHTIARKIISRRREGVKVTPVKCEIIRSLPQIDSDVSRHSGRRSGGAREDGGAGGVTPDTAAEYSSAKSELGGVAEEQQPASMRKFRSRPMTAAEEQAIADANARTDSYSPYSGPDEMVEELEPRQSHRKNRHPHSQNGLLANVMAMLSRGYMNGAEQPDTSEDEGGEEMFAAEQIVSDGITERPERPERAGEAPDNGGQDILSLSAAVEKFIEAAPLEPVLVVPRRK